MRKYLFILLLLTFFGVRNSFAQDQYEPNDSLDQASAVSAGEIQSNFHSDDDIDYFSISLFRGEMASVRSLSSSARLIVYKPDGSFVGQGSTIEWSVEQNGKYVILAEPVAGSADYTLSIEVNKPQPTVTPTNTSTPTNTPTSTPTNTPTITPSPTPTSTPTTTPSPTPTNTPTITPSPTATTTPFPTRTPVPTNTPVPTWTPAPTRTPVPTSTPEVFVDDYEYNNDRQNARQIVQNQGYSLSLPRNDVDWFSLPAKQGYFYTCTTSNRGVDTFVTLYHQDGTVLDENDDISPETTDARVEATTWYDGVMFIEVKASWGIGYYDLTCVVSSPPVTPTDVPTSRPATSVPRPTTVVSNNPTSTPVVVILPTNTSVVATSVPIVITATNTAGAVVTSTVVAPTATPLPPARQSVPYRIVSVVQVETPQPIYTTGGVRLYYDINGNSEPDPTEGIKGMSIRVVRGGDSISWQLTDHLGEAKFSVPGNADAWIIPLLLDGRTTLRSGTNNPISPWRVPLVKFPGLLPVLNPPENVIPKELNWPNFVFGQMGATR